MVKCFCCKLRLGALIWKLNCLASRVASAMTWSMLTQALAYKHVRHLWTDEAVENYNKLLFALMARGVRFP
jgi:hypothetical protein